MNKTIKTFDSIMECMNRGMIYINEQGIIEGSNRKIKEITGIILKNDNEHAAGKIETGDIVIIADNDIGNDDELSSKDLELIGIQDKNIKKGDSLIAIGVFGNKKITPLYKCVSNFNRNGTLGISTMYLGVKLNVVIDFSQKKISICVGKSKYVMTFMNAIGHMVLIDGNSGIVKFFQEKGYGFRQEEIGRILRGKEYMAKEEENESIDKIPTIGEKYDKILLGDEVCKLISKLLETNKTVSITGIYEVHKRALFCNLIRVKDMKAVNGVYIIVQDSTTMEKVLDDRNLLIHELEYSNNLRQTYKPQYDGENFDNELIGNTPVMNEVKRLAIKASKAKFNVLITGESGTGKSKLAELIHNLNNKDAPFVEVNCNAIAPSLLESELFGYVGGAFTGANQGGKEGLFEVAKGGTIFLDEIGDIPLEIQAKLLLVLQSKRIYRVGSSKPIYVDVRVITATNQNLEAKVASGEFRQDLFYRINVFPIVMPPIRERRSDLYALINTILQNICEKYETGKKQLSEGALSYLMTYSWPGNVRELENVIERAVVICDSSIIYAEDIVINGILETDENNILSLKERLKKEEERIIMETLEKNNGDKITTMKELKLSKSSFYEKLKLNNNSNNME